MNVVVFGLGYVGSVTAACLTADGHRVTGVDVAQSKVDAVRAGVPPVAEPGLEQLLRSGIESGRLSATTDTRAALSDADVAVICVGTPSAANGALTIGFVEEVSREIAEHLRTRTSGDLVVAYRSTMLPGTTRSIVQRHLGGLEHFSFAFVPEFLREATAIDDFYHPAYSIIGTDSEEAYARLSALFDAVRAPTEHVTVETAEALKYACNAFHALKVTFANEIGRLCDSVAVDGRDVMRLLASDHVLNVSEKYLRPGFAFGGSCLPKDLRAINHQARRNDVELPLLQSLLPSNALQVQRAVDHVLQQGWRDVALVGLTFKSGTDDLRESPYVELAESLLAKGVNVRVFDRNIVPARLTGANLRFIESHLPHIRRMLTNSLTEAIAGVDAVVLGCEPRASLAGVAPTVDLPVLATDDPMTLWPTRARVASLI